MSQKTREEVLEKLRPRDGRAGKEHKGKIIDEVVQLFGYHRKAALRALRMKERASGPYIIGRPKEYDSEKLAAPLKTIWLAAMQPCGERLKAALPEWLPAYESDHRRLDPDVRPALLRASRATLDRLLVPARIAHRRRAVTRLEHCGGSRFPFARNGPSRSPVFWRWILWRSVAACLMAGMSGCSMRWIFRRRGTSSERCPIAVKRRL